MECQENSLHTGSHDFDQLKLFTSNLYQVPKRQPIAGVSSKHHFPEMGSTECDPCHILIMEPASLWFWNSSIFNKALQRFFVTDTDGFPHLSSVHLFLTKT